MIKSRVVDSHPIATSTVKYKLALGLFVLMEIIRASPLLCRAVDLCFQIPTVAGSNASRSGRRSPSSESVQYANGQSTAGQGYFQKKSAQHAHN